MVPHMTARVVDPEGRTVETIAPRVQSVVMKPSTAGAVTTMMEAVVNEGTGTRPRSPGSRWPERPEPPRPRSGPRSTTSGSSRSRLLGTRASR